MNKKKLLTLLSTLLFIFGISITGQGLASEYAAEYAERKTGIDSADISRNADPDLQTIKTDDISDDDYFDEDEEEDDYIEEDEDEGIY